MDIPRGALVSAATTTAERPPLFSGARIQIAAPFLLALICAFFRVAAWSAEPAFVGYIVHGSRILLAIRENPESASRWVRVGDQLGPYSVESFDRAGGSVTLRMADTKLVLHLPESRVTPRIDISVIEALAADGNQRLASLLDTYRQIEALRDRVNTSLAGEGGSEYAERLRRARSKVDAMLSSLLDRMQAEATKLPSPRK